MNRAIAIAMLLAPACVALHAAGAETVPLTYAESGVRGLPAIAMGRRYVLVRPGVPPQLNELPEGLSEHIFHGSLDVAGSVTVVLADLGDAPRLYLDMDRDGLLAGEEALGPVEAKGMRVPRGIEAIVFGTVHLPGGAAAHLEVHRYGKVTRYLVMEPAGVQAGRVELGGQERALHLVDTDLDGRYQVAPSGRDIIAVDLDGNGSFTTESTFEAEVFALKKLLRMVGGYVEVTPAADGSSVELRPYAGPMGAVDVDDPDGGTVLVSRDGTFALSGDGSRWDVPAGSYRVSAVFLSGEDEDGARWTLASSGAPPAAKTLAVKDGVTSDLTFGQPLVLRTSASRIGRRTMSIGVTLAGKGQEFYTPGAEKDGEEMPPPDFRLVDRKGNVLVADKFEYG